MASTPPTNIPPPTNTEIVVNGGGFSISRFRSNLSKNNGPLKPSLYQVNFIGPGFDDADRSIEYLTERVEIPDVSLDTEKIRRYGYGPVEDVPYRPVFQPLRMTIIAPASNKIGLVQLINKLSGATAFNKEGGYNSINDNSLPISSGNTAQPGALSNTAYPYEVAYKDNIVFTTVVSLYDTTGAKILTYNFNKSFLRSMSPIDLSWGSNDQYVKVDMTIDYTDFYINPEV